MAKKAKNILADIRLTNVETKQSRYFFDMWVQGQRFGMSAGNQAEYVQNIFYDKLPAYISYEEFEEKIAKRYKSSSTRIDWSWNTTLSLQSGVEVHSVLDDLFFVVVSKDEIFFYQTEEKAMEEYEEQMLRRIGEAMGEEYKEYERLKSIRRQAKKEI